MSDLLELDNLYEHLEENATNYSFYRIASLFRNLFEKMHNEKKANLETIAIWEMDVFHFSTEKGVIVPSFTTPNAEGKLINHPSYENFTSDTYDHIVKRLDLTTNPLLKSRYAHVLWFSPKKHGKYAVLAIESYLELIKIFEQKEKEKTEKNYGSNIIQAMENAFYLSKNINNQEKIDLIKSEIKRLIFNYNSESTYLHRLRADLLNLMLEEKLFSSVDFNGMSDLCINFAKELADSNQAITILELGAKVENKQETVSHNWNKLIAESFEKLMRTNLENNKHAAIGYCQNALEYYRLLKNQGKIEELEVIYNNLKGNLKFGEISINIDLSKHIAECEKRAKELVAQYPAEVLIEILMLDKSLLPEYAVMAKYAQKRLENSIKSKLHISRLDTQGHIAQHFVTEEEIQYHEILTQYRIFLETHFSPFIDLLFIEAVKEGKITFQTLMQFFQKHSWFSKTINKQVQNKSIPHNWLSLIAPALFDYFTQIDFFIASRQYPNLVLSIDSLTLKIEGLFRDIFYYSGINTSHSKKDKHDQITCQENDLTRMLHEKKVSTLFTPDELLLFKFVLVEKAGYNLRNRVAHSLLFRGEYQISQIHLLLIILLKLGQYNIEPPKKEASVK